MKKFGTVAIIGRPNAGKSTLLNNLLGQKISIVSDKPQTTRHRVLGVLTEDDIQIVFTDLPGFHKPLFEMNKAMMQNVYEGLQSADVVLYIIDASEPLGGGEQYLIDQLKSLSQPVIVALNKLDKIKKSKMLPLIEELSGAGFEEIIPMSALTGDGVNVIKNVVSNHIPEGEFCYEAEYYTNISEHFYISEVIREKILNETRDELPYTTMVEMRQIQVMDDYVEILCDIVVEKKSQKPIMIGKGGKMIGTIRKRATKELEEYYEKPVDLQLHVKVEEKWRQRKKFTSQFEIY